MSIDESVFVSGMGVYAAVCNWAAAECEYDVKSVSYSSPNAT